MVVMTDPCVPWEPPSLAEDLQILFEDLPESIEKKDETRRGLHGRDRSHSR